MNVVSMIRKSIKYVLIAFLNILGLYFLYQEATYDIKLLLTQIAILNEFLMLLILFAVNLFSLRFMIFLIRRKSVMWSLKQKVVCSVILTALLSSYFYYDYGVSIYQRHYDNNRQGLANKLKSSKLKFFGSSAKELTFDEYEILRDWLSFPEIPKQAKNIGYDYSHYDFLPDYGFQLSYEVPVSEEIELIEIETEQFEQYQRFQVKGDRKLVTYYESRR